MADNYPDDFSDSEHAGGVGHNQDDEQYMQKLTGKIEVLQRELNQEKGEHAATKKKLESAMSTVSGQPTSQEEHDKGNYESSLSLRNAFTHFLVENALHISGINESSDMNDHNCMLVLKEATKTIDSLKSDKNPGAGNLLAQKSVSSRSHTPAGASNEELLNRIKNLEFELRLALGAAEDIKALKAKLLQLVDRIRIEKENKFKAEQELVSTKKKMEMLGDHMEKLMTYLKHEAASKIRAVEQLRVSERANAKLKDQMQMVNRKGVAKDRLVLELREGSKILEDQLRLMDEKYLELRTKLDYARESSIRKIKAAERTAADLRVKFALANGGTGILDNAVSLPDIYSQNGDMSRSWVSAGDQEDNSMAGSMSNSRMQIAKMKKGMKMTKGKNSMMGGGDSSHSEPPPNMDKILEKIRKQSGEKLKFDDTKLRDLVKSR